jgi:hypothetical protein
LPKYQESTLVIGILVHGTWYLGKLKVQEKLFLLGIAIYVPYLIDKSQLVFAKNIFYLNRPRVPPWYDENCALFEFSTLFSDQVAQLTFPIHQWIQRENLNKIDYVLSGYCAILGDGRDDFPKTRLKPHGPEVGIIWIGTWNPLDSAESFTGDRGHMRLYVVEKSFRSVAYWGTCSQYQLQNRSKQAKITIFRVGIVWLGTSYIWNLAEIFTGGWRHVGLVLAWKSFLATLSECPIHTRMSIWSPLTKAYFGHVDGYIARLDERIWMKFIVDIGDP